MHLYILSVNAILLLLLNYSLQVSTNEDLTLTYNQKLILDKFRNTVSARLTHSYMSEDIYLIRWLRAKKFNVGEAEKLLMENLKWREKNRMDNILDEDWNHFERDYPYTIEGCDKNGRPVASVRVGDWNVQKAVISGQSKKLKRYLDKYLEELSRVVRSAQSQGRNITQYGEIYDLGNYNLQQHFCPGCISIYIHLFQSYENHFPGETYRTTFVNTPSIFQSLFQILKPLMSPETQNILFLYGRDKREWQAALLEQSAPNQLTKALGGIREFGFEMEQFRSFEKLPC